MDTSLERDQDISEQDLDRALNQQPRAIEVAIYPGRRFYVPGTEDKSMFEQKDRLREDADELKARLGIDGIAEVLPLAAEATDIDFQYRTASGGRPLIGMYVRTDTLTNVLLTPDAPNGRTVQGLGVGRVDPTEGLRVTRWRIDHGYPGLAAARFIVPSSIVA